ISNAGAANTALSGGAAGTLRVREVAINTNGRALSIATSATVTNDATFTGFTSVTSTGGTNGVALVGVTGTVILGMCGLSGATGAKLSVRGGSETITYNGNISQANNAAMVSLGGGHVTGTITLSGTLNATNGTGLQFSNADGTYSFPGSVTLNGGGAGLRHPTGSTRTVP